MTHAIAGSALVLYILACGLFSRERFVSGRVLTGVGIGLHLFSLWFWIRTGALTFDVGHSLSIVAVVSAIAFLLLGEKRLRGLQSGVMLAIVIIYALSAVAIHLDETAREIPHWSGMLISHIATTLAGVICFLICGFCSTVFLLQDRALKKRELQGLSRMPSLRELSQLSRQFLAAGVWAMTIGLWFGFLIALDAQFRIPLRDPKLLWSALMLLYFGILLTARSTQRVSELRFARFCSLGLVLVTLALFSTSKFH